MAGTAKLTHVYTPSSTESSNIKVFIRARPPEDKSEKFEFLDVSNDGQGDIKKQVTIRDPNAARSTRGDVSYSYDRIFWVDDDQEVVFNSMCKPQVDHVLNGYNACCFAYGQTGSGKTHTMFGAEGGIAITGEVRGMIPRAVEYLFTRLAQKSATSEVAMVCSFLEIYIDQIRDLGKAYLVEMGNDSDGGPIISQKTSDLFENIAAKRGNPYFAPAFRMRKSESAERLPGLKEVRAEYAQMNYEIREDTEGNVFVKDLSLIPVSSLEEVKQLIGMGLSVRATHETKMNSTSSRSHTVFTITIVQRDKKSGESTQAMLNLIDLAGSERLKKSESQGLRLKEALAINTSLTALGKVIVALDPASESTHVPYRDCKLTRVLQNSLGGNSYTTVLAAMHPSAAYYEECLSTLQFANRCRNVVNNPRVNYVGEDDKDGKIRRLMQEIAMLRMKVGVGSSSSPDGAPLAALSPDIIAEILNRFGIPAEVDPLTGQLVVDGNPVSLSELGLGGKGDGSPAKKLAVTRKGFGAGAVVTEMKEELKEALAEKRELRKAVTELGKELGSTTNQLVRAQTFLKNLEHKYNEALKDKGVALTEQEENLRRFYSNELRDVVLNSQALLQEQYDAVDAIPESLREFSDKKKKMHSLKLKEDKPIKEYYEDQIRSIKENNDVVLESVKLQYGHWIGVKDKQIKDFVDKFNDYRLKKSKQLKKAEEEIIHLYRHTQAMEEILDDVGRGVYPVQAKQGQPVTGMAELFPRMMDGAGGGTEGQGGPNPSPPSRGSTGERPKSGRVLIPKSVRPPNPFNVMNLKTGTSDPNHLKLTKKIVEKYHARGEADRKLQEKLFNQQLLKENIGGPFSDDQDHENAVTATLKEFIYNTKAAKASVERAKSAALARSDNMVGHKGHISKPARPATAGAEREAKTPTLSHPFATDASLTAAESTSILPVDSITKHESGVQFAGEGLEDSYGEGLLPMGIEGVGVEVGETGGDSMVAQLRAKIAALEETRKVERLNDFKVVEALGNNDTLQYIYSLEETQQQLSKDKKDLGVQLQASKVANSSLQRKIDKLQHVMKSSGLFSTKK